VNIMSSPDLVALSLTAAAAPLVEKAPAAPRTVISATEIVDGPLALSRALIDDDPGSPVETRANQDLTRAAVALDSDAVFSDARRRIERVFQLNVILLLILAVLLLVGIGGAIYAALFLDRNSWALIFGGVAVADIIGIYVFKPITAINRALVATQQLDLLYLRLREGMKGCEELSDVNEKIACRDAVWDRIWADLSSLNQIA
jgi:hypothetical protein